MSEGLEKKPLPEGWRWVKLGEVMPDYVGTIDPRQYPDELFALHSIPAYETGKPDILPGRKIGSSKQFVKVGDVLLSKIVPHIRRSWVVETCETENLIASTEWIVFRSNVVDPWFLQYALRTDEFHKRFIDTTSGVCGSLTRARPKLVAEITIPLPPLPDQQRIAAILREQMAVVDKARKAAEEELEAINALPAALLRRAFSGEL
jgi:type I restriction enzyme S subunit